MSDQIPDFQANIQGGVNGPVLPGRFEGPVAVGPSAEAVDARGSMNLVYKPSIYQSPIYARANYRAEIADLLHFYTVTFVGREDVLNRLMTLAATPEPSYHLVGAPPGYGKTALLVQLLYRHEHGDWPGSRPTLLVCFIRQEGGRNTATDFLRALNSQLLTALNLPGGIPNELELLRTQFIDLWNQTVQAASAERPLLLLVDGLDEMSSIEPTVAQVLPGLLGPHVHIVVSSRPNPPALEQVSIEHPFRQTRVLSLQRFGPAEVRALLTNYGDPIAREETFVERLLRLTNGEPLFLRFLCQQVAEWGEGAEAELTALPKLKGVEDYFRQQLKQLCARAEGELVYDVLGLLLAAYGGMTVDELADAMEQRKVAIDDAIQPIRRFLLGETRLELMHPEFRRAVATLFRPRERQECESKLLGYARTTWREDSQYALSHLAQYLYNAGNVDELLSLIENPKWQRARCRDDLAGSGLARDVEWACRAAEAGDLATLTQYVVASLLKARLRSQITNLPVEVVEAFARLGRFDQALALTNLVVREVPRVTALWRLGQWCLEKGDLDTAVDLLKQARVGILALEKDKNRPCHLARLASHFHQAEQPGEAQRSLDVAFELVNTLEGEVEQGSALVALVRGMYDYNTAMLEDCLAEAERAVGQIERIHSYRALALARIAEQLYRIDAEHARTLVEEALSILSSSPTSYGGEGISGIVFSQRDVFLATVIGIAARIGLEDRGLGLLQTIEGSAARATAYAELGRAHVDQQHTGEAETYLQQALAIAETELKGVTLDSFKCHLVNLLLRISQVDQAQQVTKSIQDQTERVNAFCAVAEHLSQNGRGKDAHNWLEQMGVDWGRAFGKAVIGATLIESGPESALEEVSEALQLARQIREGIVGTIHDVYALIAACIRELADTRPKRAKELLDQIVEDLQSAVGRHSLEITGVTQAHNEALACLVEAIANSGHYTEGARIANSIAHGYVRDQALLLCVRAAYAVGDWDIVDILLSEMTGDCWRLIGKAARQGWQAQTDQALDELLEIIEERVSEACSWFPRPTDALGYAALELGISGHIAAAQALWTKMDNPIARQESQVELVRLLTQAGRVEDAQRLVNDIEYASSKAKALAYIARFYSDKDLPHAQELVAQAWREINPHDLPPEYRRNWYQDKTIIVLAGTVARWNLSEADRIVKEWIKEDDSRQRARGEVIAAISTIDPKSAYTLVSANFTV